MAFDFEDDDEAADFDENPPVEAEEPTEPPLMYPHAAAWVEGFVLPHFKRNPSTHRWDAEWWLYPEATAVLEALWQSWEYLRHQGATGMAVFFKDYFYPLMHEITGPEGPFWLYHDHRDRKLPGQWSVAEPPDGFFKDESE